jgi:hypothetical protein
MALFQDDKGVAVDSLNELGSVLVRPIANVCTDLVNRAWEETTLCYVACGSGDFNVAS